MKGRKIAGIVCMVFGVLGVLATQGKADLQKTSSLITFIGILLYFVRGKSAGKKSGVKELAKKQITAKHEDGLPLAEGVSCTISYENETFVFTGGGNEFRLQLDNITDICIKTEVEIQRAYVSSIGGAVLGAELFGSLGAMIGGRVKERKITETSYFLIYTYLKDEGIKYISFEMPKVPKVVKQWISALKKQPIPSVRGKTIDL